MVGQNLGLPQLPVQPCDVEVKLPVAATKPAKVISIVVADVMDIMDVAADTNLSDSMSNSSSHCFLCLSNDATKSCKKKSGNKTYWVHCSAAAHSGSRWVHNSCAGIPNNQSVDAAASIGNFFFICNVCLDQSDNHSPAPVDTDSANTLDEDDSLLVLSQAYVADAAGGSDTSDSPTIPSTVCPPASPTATTTLDLSNSSLLPPTSSSNQPQHEVLTDRCNVRGKPSGESTDDIPVEAEHAEKGVAGGDHGWRKANSKNSKSHSTNPSSTTHFKSGCNRPNPRPNIASQTSTRSDHSVKRDRPISAAEKREHVKARFVAEELRKIRSSTSVVVIGASHLRFCNSLSHSRNELQLIQLGGLCVRATTTALGDSDLCHSQVSKVLIHLGTNDLLHHKGENHREALEQLAEKLIQRFPKAKLHLVLPFKSRTGRQINEGLISKWNQSVPTQYFKVHSSPTVDSRDFRDEIHLDRNSKSFKDFYKYLCRLCNVSFAANPFNANRNLRIPGRSYSRAAVTTAPSLLSLDFSGDHPVKDRVGPMAAKSRSTRHPPTSVSSAVAVDTTPVPHHRGSTEKPWARDDDLSSIFAAVSKSMQQTHQLLQLVMSKSVTNSFLV